LLNNPPNGLHTLPQFDEASTYLAALAAYTVLAHNGSFSKGFATKNCNNIAIVKMFC